MTALFVLTLFAPLAIAAAQSAPPYGSCVRAFQSGMIERAIADLKSRSFDKNLDDDVGRWIESAREARRPADLEAALLLHTEVFFSTWEETFPPARAPGHSTELYAQAQVIRRLQRELVSYAHATPFLRTWYLLWESFTQGRSALELTQYGNYLEVAVRAFPDDPEVLLAAGMQYELRWWSAYDNPQRHPTGAAGSAAQNLRSARDWFRKGLAVSGYFNETRLRLGRVLLMLGEVEAAEAELRRLQSSAKDPGLRYMGGLLLGELYERRGDLEAAASSYDAAAKLVPFPQSARLASAYVSHLRGNRKEAASAVVSALSIRSPDYDPWWLYTRGYALQFERLVQLARGFVRGASTGSAR